MTRHLVDNKRFLVLHLSLSYVINAAAIVRKRRHHSREVKNLMLEFVVDIKFNGRNILGDTSTIGVVFVMFGGTNTYHFPRCVPGR